MRIGSSTPSIGKCTNQHKKLSVYLAQLEENVYFQDNILLDFQWESLQSTVIAEFFKLFIVISEDESMVKYFLFLSQSQKSSLQTCQTTENQQWQPSQKALNSTTPNRTASFPKRSRNRIKSISSQTVFLLLLLPPIQKCKKNGPQKDVISALKMATPQYPKEQFDIAKVFIQWHWSQTDHLLGILFYLLRSLFGMEKTVGTTSSQILTLALMSL